MPLIKIATLNVRGLNESKAMYLLNFIIRSEIVCLLQETHIKSSSELEKIKSVFYQFSCVFPLCESNSKGVGLLIRKKSNIITKNIFHDLNNRVLGCEVCFDNCLLNSNISIILILKLIFFDYIE
jgi:exonuclease III